MRAGDLLANAKNWRQHPGYQRDAMRGVLGEIGFAATLTAYETPAGELVLIDGHLRVEEAPDLEVDVAILDVNEEEADKLLLTMDPLGAMASPNPDALIALLDSARFDDGGVNVMLEALASGETSPITHPQTTDEQDEANAAAALEEADAKDYVAFTERGQLWQLGRHRLYCGDMTDDADVAALLQGESAAAVWTDPPYAIYGSSTGIGADITDDKVVRPFFEVILRRSSEALALFGHAYICCDWRSWASWWEMAKRTLMEPKNLIVWDMGGGGLGTNYTNTYELVGYFAKLPPPTTMLSKQKTGQRSVNKPNMVRVNRAFGSERQHNAAKPVELIEYSLEPSTDPGGLVVDWFVGSGSTIIACEKLGRRCYAMEIEPRYVDVAIRRWELYTGEKAVLDVSEAEADDD